ncbi:MAG: ElyC/SanA/YdcF family protein [Candidatus Moraniibacteriota bacterium]
MNVIFVLYKNGWNHKKLSLESKMRIWAAVELLKCTKKTAICFVGGNYKEHISGANRMKQYWQDNFGKLPYNIFVLDSSNNTSENIKEIKSFLGLHKEFDEGYVLSSSYHRQRVTSLLKTYGLRAKIVEAEKLIIIRGDDERKEEAIKYLESTKYKISSFVEKLLNIYLFIDPKQKVIGLWRRLIYKL